MGFLNEKYIHWLKHTTATTDAHSKKMAKDLISLLPEMFRLKDLIALFSGCTPPLSNEKDPILNPENGFYSQLAQWVTELEVIKQNINFRFQFINVALQACNTLNLPPHVICLMQIIKELVGEQAVHSHLQIINLFNILSDPDFPAILSYLSSLEETPNSPLIRRGTFNGVPPIDDKHAAVLKLLNNLDRSDKKDSISDKANIFLQSTLMIYLDYNTVTQALLTKFRATIQTSIPEAEEEDWGVCCSLM